MPTSHQAGLAVLGAPLRMSPENRSLLRAIYLPWALRSGSQCSPLIGIPYERHLEQPLDVVRAMWRIIPAPPRAESLAQLGALRSASRRL